MRFVSQSLWNLALAFLCVLFTIAVIDQAQAADLPLANIPTVADADVYAKELITQLKAENDKDPARAADPILIMHVGNELPAPLKWVILSLDRARIPYEVELVTQDQLGAALDDAAQHAVGVTSVLNYGEGPGAERANQAVENVHGGAKLMLKRVFGMPGGFTMWVKLKRTVKQKLGEAGAGVIQGVIAGASFAFSLYLATQHGGHPNIEAGVATMIAWVTANAYWGRTMSEWQNQGRELSEPKEGVFKARKGNAFFLLTSAVRSLLTNALLVGSAFGLDRLMVGQTWITSVENTGVNLVARSWIDQWINKHQATTLPDGSVEVREGQWSPKKTIVVSTVWNVLYGLLKNLDLLNIAPAHWTYITMGVVGFVKMFIIDERFSIKRQWNNITDAIRGAARSQCESLLIRKSAVRALDLPVAAASS